MEDEFEFEDKTLIFDFKGFLLKILSYWYIILISIIVGLGIAYYINVRKLPIYKISSMVTVKDDNNPLFTSNTSLTFNWGGVSNKVNTAITTLQTRSHNEKVVKRLKSYIQYLEDGQYQKVNAYGRAPFYVEDDTTAFQLLNRELEIKVLDSLHYQLSLNFEEDAEEETLSFLSYGDLDRKSEVVDANNYSVKLQFNKYVDTPYFSGRIMLNGKEITYNKPYYIKFENFFSTVKRFQNIEAETESKGSSIINLSLVGENKSELVSYLNSTVNVLSRDVLNRKNLFATKTIKFVDSILNVKTEELREVERELNQFKIDNDIIDLTAESESLKGRLKEYDTEINSIERQLDYYRLLENYLRNRSDYSDVPAPSVAGIEESSISTAVSKIVELSVQRGNYSFSLKSDAPIFKDIDRQINSTKTVILENIESSRNILNDQRRSLKSKIASIESEVRELPKDQQELLKIERRFQISENTYTVFLQKRNEASLIKAANVSDIEIIDEAKDTGGGKIGPNTQLNYVMALLIGSIVPLLFIFIIVFLDNKISKPADVEKLSQIPIIGIIGKSRLNVNLAVFTKPRSSISESFRGIRTSLQFLYKRDDNPEDTKVTLVTSSVSGEGKTFTAINLASVLSLSGKKTILVGLDLRKPKIFDDFDRHNEVGVVNYLIGDKNIDEVIQGTDYENLDLIVSGATPPNPSELLIGDRMDQFMDELRGKYDYIVLDTPPIGLVTDAMNLFKYTDATLYLIRQNYTKKGMLSLINDKHKKGEVKNISIVLNCFEQKNKYGYDYGYGYGYGYGRYGNGYHDLEKTYSLRRQIKKKLKNFINKIFN